MKVINFEEERSVTQRNSISLTEERFNDDSDQFSNFIKENFNVKTFEELGKKLDSGELEATEIVLDYANQFDEDRKAFDVVEYDDDCEENVFYTVDEINK